MALEARREARKEEEVRTQAGVATIPSSLGDFVRNCDSSLLEPILWFLDIIDIYRLRLVSGLTNTLEVLTRAQQRMINAAGDWCMTGCLRVLLDTDLIRRFILIPVAFQDLMMMPAE